MQRGSVPRRPISTLLFFAARSSLDRKQVVQLVLADRAVVILLEMKVEGLALELNSLPTYPTPTRSKYNNEDTPEFIYQAVHLRKGKGSLYQCCVSETFTPDWIQNNCTGS